MGNEVLADGYIGPIRDGVSWTPHDTNPIVDGSGNAQPWRGLIADTDGILVVTTQGGGGNQTITVNRGMPLPIHVRKILSTGTSGVTTVFVYI